MKSGSFVSQLPSSLGRPGPLHRQALGKLACTCTNVCSHHREGKVGWDTVHSGSPGEPVPLRRCFVSPRCSHSVICSPPSELEDLVEDLKKDSTSAGRVVTLKDVEDGAFLLRQVGEAVASLKGELPRGYVTQGGLCSLIPSLMHARVRHTPPGCQARGTQP